MATLLFSFYLCDGLARTVNGAPILPCWCTLLRHRYIPNDNTQRVFIPPCLSCAPSLTWLWKGPLVFDCSTAEDFNLFSLIRCCFNCFGHWTATFCLFISVRPLRIHLADWRATRRGPLAPKQLPSKKHICTCQLHTPANCAKYIAFAPGVNHDRPSNTSVWNEPIYIFERQYGMNSMSEQRFWQTIMHWTRSMLYPKNKTTRQSVLFVFQM